MKQTRLAAAMAVVIMGAAVASAAHAQTMQWRPGQHRQEPDPAKRLPEASQQAPAQPQAVLQPAPDEVQPSYTDAPPPAETQPQSYAVEQPVSFDHEADRGGFFLGVQGGKGQVYEDVEQTALSVNAGYRWQAGPVSLIGVEVAGGRLDSTTEDDWRYGKVEYASIGANARFNFGRGNPLYGLVRAGY